MASRMTLKPSGAGTEGALGQIRERNYPAVLQGYGGEVVLVGINYNPRTKIHTCAIEKLENL